MTGPEPLLRVVRGQPTDEEAAAVTVVLAAKLAARPVQAREERAAPGGWADRARAVRAPLTPGPGAWRRSASLR
jgi:Acyl-CoA carboxylase epsilon subunit